MSQAMGDDAPREKAPAELLTSTRQKSSQPEILTKQLTSPTPLPAPSTLNSDSAQQHPQNRYTPSSQMAKVYSQSLPIEQRHTTNSAPDRQYDSGSGTDSATYGARSRHRGGPRPNYADDDDMDIEYVGERSVPAAQRPLPSDPPAMYHQPYSAVSASPSAPYGYAPYGFAKLTNSDFSPANGSHSNGSASAYSQDAQKKRKHEKSTTAKTPVAYPPQSREQAPQPQPMSFYFVDNKPSKKRRIGEHYGQAAKANAGSPAAPSPAPPVAPAQIPISTPAPAPRPLVTTKPAPIQKPPPAPKSEAPSRTPAPPKAAPAPKPASAPKPAAVPKPAQAPKPAPAPKVVAAVPKPAATAVVAGPRKGSTSHMKRSGAHPSCLVTFEKSGAILQNGKLVADDGTTFAANDNAYLICEPPGEAYYLCRIMEFRHADAADPRSPVVSMLVNWFYRPKDIGKYNIDTRYLFASMQSDDAPITSIRGKCEIRHRAEIENLDEYRKRRDTFWFNQLYDRYIKRPYELVPVSAVINVPENVKKALDERWKFLAVEPPRMKELTSKIKLCQRCNKYCAPTDSVDCGVCRNTWHMSCVRPALTRKPTRGFAWSCGACSRAHEQKLEARHAAVVTEPGTEEEEIVEEEEDPGKIVPKPDPEDFTQMQIVPEAQQEDALAKLWPWRYLGIHCRVEDVLQYDDRAIYPRASSRLGAKHEAVVLLWPGRPIEYVKTLEIKKRYTKGGKKDSKLSKEQLAALEAEKLARANRPIWVQDEPAGYVARGEDLDNDDPNNTCQRLFIIPEEEEDKSTALTKTNVNERILDSYMEEVRALAKTWGLTRPVHPGTKGYVPKAHEPSEVVPTNFLDKATQLLYKHHFDKIPALQALKAAHGPKDYGDPTFSKEEFKRFEDGVAKFGSELRLVKKAVKTRPYGEIVRFFYTWKKSERGQPVWERAEGRSRIRKKAEASWPELADDDDDSAFDNDKAVYRKRKFVCKFCDCRSSRQWRRAPGVPPGAVQLADPKGSTKDKANQLVLSLCERCAFLWRRYAMRWEDPEEISKTVIQAGGRAWKRKSDEELLRELIMANELAGVVSSPATQQAAAMIGITITVLTPVVDSTKKKLKAAGTDSQSASPAPDTQVKKKEKVLPPPPPPREPTPPIIPAEPKWRELPCSVCFEMAIEGDTLCTCTSCKLTVHKRCYGISEQSSNNNKWVCDTCMNDKNNQASLDYKCVLCPLGERTIPLIEPPKVSHRKKNDREKEKERLEKVLVDELATKYHKDQVEKGRPLYPREAVKKTASNNWAHIVCSVWTPEIRFSEAPKMENAENILTALGNPARLETLCKVCRISHGACISCFQCGAAFHAACAQEAGYSFGFDITPVKGSRKDQSQIVTLGEETGTMQAAVWCREHTIKTVFHPMNEIAKDTGLTGLQTYVRVFKQADKSLTGTARKANMFSQQYVKTSQLVAGPTPLNRRASLLVNAKARSTPDSTMDDVSSPLPDGAEPAVESQHRCVTCDTETSVWWYKKTSGSDVEMDSSSEAWQCHKCHTNDKLGVKVEPSKLEDNKEPTSIILPDFFELTAPPTPSATEAPSDGLDPWTLKLWASKVYMTDLNGQEHILSGKIFGRLDDNPNITWTFFHRHVNVKMGFDLTRHLFVTENNRVINSAKSLISGLGDMIIANLDHAEWKMYESTPELLNLVPHVLPRPAQVPNSGNTSQYLSRPSVEPVSLTRTSSSVSTQERHPLLPPMQQQLLHSPRPLDEIQTMYNQPQPQTIYPPPPPQQHYQHYPQMSSPYGSFPPPPTTAPRPPVLNGGYSHPQSASPPSAHRARESSRGSMAAPSNMGAMNGSASNGVSRDQQQQQHQSQAHQHQHQQTSANGQGRGGASMSPSLRNLVH